MYSTICNSIKFNTIFSFSFAFGATIANPSTYHLSTIKFDVLQFFRCRYMRIVYESLYFTPDSQPEIT